MMKAILKTGDPNLIHTVCEIAHNLLCGNVKLSPKRRRFLEKYKRELRQISCPKRSVALKRKLLIQKGGGFLPVLLGSILSGVVSTLADKYLKKNDPPQ